MPEPSSPQRGASQPWLLAAVLVTAVLALGAGLLARGWYMHPARVTTGQAPSHAQASPSREPGADRVRLSADAAAHPDGHAVQQTLQDYFDAINQGDYDKWLSAVTSDRAEEKTRAQWHAEYRSTKDGQITVYRIGRAGPGQLRVLLGFDSVQDQRDAPSDFPYRCIRWRVVFPFAYEHGRWKLDAGETGASPQHDQC